MTDNTDSLLFWIEQEPVDSNTAEVIYLPPDTPTGQASPKIQYQRNRTKELQKIRATERLRILHLESLADFRRKFAAETKSEHLPNQHKDHLETVGSQTYLKENLQDILKLVEDIDKIKTDENIVESLHVQKDITSEAVRHKLYLNEQVRIKYAEALESKFNSRQAQLRNQFSKLLGLINPNLTRHTTGSIESDALSTTTSPPHGTRIADHHD